MKHGMMLLLSLLLAASSCLGGLTTALARHTAKIRPTSTATVTRVPPTATATSIATATSTPTNTATANPPSTPTATPVPTTPLPLAISVSGNHLVDQNGTTVHLIGINRDASSQCIKGVSDFLGDTTAAQIAAWRVNFVRIPANEDCWLGINGAPAAYSGANYQNAIVSFVNDLHSYGIYAQIDLHWSAPGTYASKAQQGLTDTDHGLDYWTSVANAFKNDPATIFSAYNEPRITSANSGQTTPWACWRDGCAINQVIPCGGCAAVSSAWQAAGMQQVVTTIRATGATNPIVIEVPVATSDISPYLSYVPTDPDNGLIFDWHNYGSAANTGSGWWDQYVKPIAAVMPALADEFGEQDCQTSFVTSFMAWADINGVSYSPWGWLTGGCAGYGMLTSFDGTPDAYGQVIHDHYQSIHP